VSSVVLRGLFRRDSEKRKVFCRFSTFQQADAMDLELKKARAEALAFAF
jgi:hypothetical protein